MPSVADVVSDLADEHLDLDRVLEPLDADQWDLPTASVGWTVADQVGHLCYFDRSAALAITDAEAFKRHVSDLLEGLLSNGADSLLEESRSLSPPEQLRAWREGRSRLIEAASVLDDDTRLAWYGPDMSAKSFLTARLMETWAHGLDACSAVGVSRTPTDRLRHIAQLGVITRTWSYLNRGLDPSSTPVRVALDAPSGAEWSWGDENAAESVMGPAEDFCRVVTQRVHPADTELVISGGAAIEWMELAQAFAGGASDGPAQVGAA